MNKKRTTTPANSSEYGDLGLQKSWDQRDIKSKPLTEQGRKNWDLIFKPKDTRERAK